MFKIRRKQKFLLPIVTKHITAVIIIFVISGLGSLVWQRSQAASGFISIEPELGTKAHGASIVQDTGASGDGAVKFAGGTTDNPSSPPSSGTFVHPGILVSRGQLDFVKAKIASGQQPWTSAFNKMKASPHASLSLVPRQRAIVECGPSDKPDYGCKDEIFDSIAAYTHALAWYYSGNAAHGRKSIEIMNAWSGTLQAHTNFNAPLQAAWTAEMFTRAAEIMRHTSSDWSKADQQRYAALLTNVYLRDMNTPDAVMKFRSYNGNWHASAIEAKMNIAIFNDDRALFDTTLKEWKERTPSYFYLRSDNGGNGLPIPPPGGAKDRITYLKCFWLSGAPDCANATLKFTDGHAQETCRDLMHTAMGLSALINAAETAYIQKVDLYNIEQRRLAAGLEHVTNLISNGGYTPSLCNGRALPGVQKAGTYTIAYNHFAGRKGMSLPQAKKVVDGFAASGGSATHRTFAWETLTHANTASANVGN